MPTLSASPPSGILKDGEQFMLTCQSESYGQQMKYYFFKDNQAQTNNDTSKNTFIITGAQVSHNGHYSCQVEINGVKSNNSLTKQIRIIGKKFSFISLMSF